MLEVGGRPFVDWQLERLATSGIEEVIMCVGYLGEQIRAHVGHGQRFGLHVLWSEDVLASPGVNPEQVLLGTAGAVRAALDLLAPLFLVTYGDSYLPFDYSAPLRALAQHGDCDGVMAAYKNDGQWDASNVVTDGLWVLRYEKGVRDPAFDHIDYGATALKREVIAALPAGKRHGLDEVQHDLSLRKRLRACIAHERFFEIGSPEGLAALDRHLGTRSSP